MTFWGKFANVIGFLFSVIVGIAGLYAYSLAWFYSFNFSTHQISLKWWKISLALVVVSLVGSVFFLWRLFFRKLRRRS